MSKKTKATKAMLFLEWIAKASMVRVGGKEGPMYSRVQLGQIRNEPNNALVTLMAPPAPAHRFTEAAIEQGGFNNDTFVAVDQNGKPVLIEALVLQAVPKPQ